MTLNAAGNVWGDSAGSTGKEDVSTGFDGLVQLFVCENEELRWFGDLPDSESLYEESDWSCRLYVVIDELDSWWVDDPTYFEIEDMGYGQGYELIDDDTVLVYFRWAVLRSKDILSFGSYQVRVFVNDTNSNELSTQITINVIEETVLEPGLMGLVPIIIIIVLILAIGGIFIFAIRTQPTEPITLPSTDMPKTTPHPPISRTQRLLYQLPKECSECGAPLNWEEVDWVGPLQAKCPYCGHTAEMRLKET
ncbi:MAG: hypothetical protein ACFFDP_07545 [Promethearchaeota archaeon]